MDRLVVVRLSGGNAEQSVSAVCVDLERGLATGGKEWAALVREDRMGDLLFETGATLVHGPEEWDGETFGDGTGGTVRRDPSGQVVGSGLNKNGLWASITS